MPLYYEELCTGLHFGFPNHIIIFIEINSALQTSAVILFHILKGSILLKKAMILFLWLYVK